MKSAVYLGTRNIYKDMTPCLKSLLLHTDVEKVYFLIEDDEFPEYLPPCVEVINVSGQKFFTPDGPNFVNPWTWMALMKAALSKVLPDDTVLVLDYDVFFVKDIGSELWDIDLDGYYFAGVTEPKKQGFRQPYINFGVLLLNMKKIREDGMDDRFIHSLNTEYTFTNEQDVMNRMCREYIKTIPSTYNSNDYVAPCEDPKVIHFAGIGENFPWSGKRWQDFPIVDYFRNMAWEDIR